jgi:hypothetical protein
VISGALHAGVELYQVLHPDLRTVQNLKIYFYVCDICVAAFPFNSDCPVCPLENLEAQSFMSFPMHRNRTIKMV